MSWTEKFWLPILIVSIILLIFSSLFIEIHDVSTTPVWVWIVGAIAIAILIAAVIIYMVSISRKHIQECLESIQDDDEEEEEEPDKIVEETRL